MNKLLLMVAVLNLFVGCAANHRGPELLQNGVRFTFSAPTASSVAIAGSFNRWDPQRGALVGPDSHGIWSIILPLPPGRYEYLFIINGDTWLPDPAVPSVDDGLGGENSVIDIRK